MSRGSSQSVIARQNLYTISPSNSDDAFGPHTKLSLASIKDGVATPHTGRRYLFVKIHSQTNVYTLERSYKFELLFLCWKEGDTAIKKTFIT
jgi:hypothetical protein